MNKVRELRISKGISQKNFAAMLNVPPNTYNQWENGKRQPDFAILAQIADYFEVTIDYLLGKTNIPNNSKGVVIPVLGVVPAGIPLEAIEEVLDYEEITEDMARDGKYIALQIKGDSMLPTICNGDVVIVRLQPDVESGETAIVMVNGHDATCKKVVKHTSGITLVPNNPAYEPRYFTNEEISSTPVRILGKVVELRRKF